MHKIKKILLDLLLLIIFKTKVYVYPFVQSCIKLQLIIKVGDKFVLVEEDGRIKIPSVAIRLEKNHSIVFTVKKFLKKKVSKKINANSYFKLSLIDFCREVVETKHEKNLFVDDLYIKFDLSDGLTAKDLEKNAMLCDLHDIKLLHFKNKFNTFDYRVLVNSQTTEGIDIK